MAPPLLSLLRTGALSDSTKTWSPITGVTKKMPTGTKRYHRANRVKSQEDHRTMPRVCRDGIGSSGRRVMPWDPSEAGRNVMERPWSRICH